MRARKFSVIELGQNRGVVVIGAGGHAKVAIEALRFSGWNVIGCTDRVATCHKVVGAPVLGDDDKLQEIRRSGIVHAFPALGSNSLREKKSTELKSMGFKLVSCAGPNAVISPSAIIGDGVAIFAGAIINANAQVGDYTIINTNASVDHDCLVGIAAHIAPRSCLAGCVEVGDRSFLGVGTSVIPDVVIGKDCIIGAGSVVIRNIADNVVAMGVPAKIKV